MIFFLFKSPDLHATCRAAFIAVVRQLAFQEITIFFKFVSNGHLWNGSSWHLIVLEPELDICQIYDFNTFATYIFAVESLSLPITQLMIKVIKNFLSILIKHLDNLTSCHVGSMSMSISNSSYSHC